ncbi:MAG: YdgA family protein [Steroidobacteraceae bacterium]|nr:YdgA family protein [Steroidobacteraceae bacterium]
MKKTLPIIVAALVVLYPGLAWLTGFAIESRLDLHASRPLAQAPYLKLLAHSYRRGWFTSEETLSFGFSPVLLPGSPGGAAAPLVRLTIHNIVHHGPICGFTCFGLARIDTQVSVSKAVRGMLAKYFGKQAPLSIRTRMGFFGGGTTRISSPAIKGAVVVGGVITKSAGFSFLARYGRGARWYSVRATAPSFAIATAAGKRFDLGGLSVRMDMRRVAGMLYVYDGDFSLSIKRLAVDGGGAPGVVVGNLVYAVKSESRDGYLNYALRFDTGAVSTPTLSLSNAHFDLTLKHLQMAAIEAMTTDFETLNRSANPDPRVRMQKVMQIMRRQGLALLQHDPQLNLDRISVANAGGQAILTGTIGLHGVTAADFSAGMLGSALRDKLDAKLAFSLDDKMLQGLPGNGAALNARLQSLAQQGFLVRANGLTRATIVIQQGRTTVNGHSLSPPQP